MHPQTLRYLRDQGPRPPAAQCGRHAPLLGGATSTGCARSSGSRRSWASTPRAGNRWSRWSWRTSWRTRAQARAARAPPCSDEVEMGSCRTSTSSIAGTSCSTATQAASQKGGSHGLQQAHRSRRRRRSLPAQELARKFPGEPGAPPGASPRSRCSTRSRRASLSPTLTRRPERRGAQIDCSKPRRTVASRVRSSSLYRQPGLLPGFEAARQGGGRCEAARGRLHGRPSTCCSRSTSCRSAAAPRREEEGGARRPARHVGGSGGDVRGAEEVRP